MTNEKIKRQLQQSLDESFRKAMTGNVQTIAKDAPPRGQSRFFKSWLKNIEKSRRGFFASPAIFCRTT